MQVLVHFLFTAIFQNTSNIRKHTIVWYGQTCSSTCSKCKVCVGHQKCHMFTSRARQTHFCKLPSIDINWSSNLILHLPRTRTDVLFYIYLSSSVEFEPYICIPRNKVFHIALRVLYLTLVCHFINIHVVQSKYLIAKASQKHIYRASFCIRKYVRKLKYIHIKCYVSSRYGCLDNGSTPVL